MANFLGVLFRLSSGKVNLVQHGDDREVIFHGQVEVCQSLGLNALCGINKEDRAFTCGQGSRNLVGKVDVSGGVDHIQGKRFTLISPRHTHGLTFDGDAAFALDIHTIQVLIAHISTGDHTGELEHAVSQSGLAVIDVSDDAEITDTFLRSGRGLDLRELLRSRNRGQARPPEGL